MTSKVLHMSVSVSDMDRSLVFYRDLLGLQVVADNEWGVKDEWLTEVTGFPDAAVRAVVLKLTTESDTLLDLELVQYRHPVGVRADVPICNPGASHLALLVEDIHHEYERLKAAGVRFRSAPVAIQNERGSTQYLVFLEDPDGFWLEFFQPPAST